MNTMMKIFRPLLITGACIAGVLLTGCAQIQLGPPVASVENIQKAKASGMAPVTVGDFRLAEGKPAEMDKKVSVRGANTAESPYQNSFAQYLKQTLETELKAAGLYDTASQTRIIGWLTDSQLEVPISEGTGRIAARFVVERNGSKIYDKELVAQAKWPSSFVAAVAVPAAFNEYGALYRKLVTQLLDDAAFKAAVAKK